MIYKIQAIIINENENQLPRFQCSVAVVQYIHSLMGRCNFRIKRCVCCLLSNTNLNNDERMGYSQGYRALLGTLKYTLKARCHDHNFGFSLQKFHLNEY